MIKIRYLLMAFLSIVFISLNAIGSTIDSYSFNVEDLNEFNNKYGDWQLTNDFNSINLQGKSIPLEGLSKEANYGSIETSIRNFIDENGNLLKINENDLKTIRVVNSNDEWNVKFEQEYNGIKVYNSKVIVNVKDNKIVKLKSSFYNNINIDTKPSISEKEVRKIAVQYLGKKAKVENTELMIYPVTEKGNNFFKLVYRVEFSEIFDEKPIKYIYFIDANDKEIINIENAIKEAAIQGTVTVPYRAEYPSQPLVNANAKNQEVKINNVINAYTNTNGFYYQDGLSGNVNLLFKLKGRYVDVDNLNVNEASHTRTISVPNTYNVNWSSYDLSYQKEESNMYYHVNLLHDYFNSGNALNFNELNFVTDANVAYGPNYCGAFSNRLAITFSRSTQNCNSLALSSDIIYHEYTHNLIYGIYGITWITGPEGPALNEALSDYFAVSTNNNAYFAEEVYYGAPQGTNLDNNYYYPIDLGNGVYQDGAIFSGALWDTRRTLGRNLNDNLVAEVLRMEPNSFQQFLLDMLVADDNNGNLNDGTPNINAICSGFYDQHTIYSDYCRGHTNGPIAFIANPLHNDRILIDEDGLDIVGTVAGSLSSPLNYYKVEYKFYNDPEVLISQGNSQIINGNLAHLDVNNLPEGEYQIIVTSRTSNNAVQSYRILVNLFRLNLNEAAITCDGHPCIASPDLIKSRGDIDVPEFNFPNTVDECTDGNSGSYLEQQSVENIQVENLDNSNLYGQPVFFKGDLVRVTMTIWCGQLSDQLVIAYMGDTGNAIWEQKARTYCYGTQQAYYNLSATFNLDNKEGNHVIRAIAGDYTNLGTYCGAYIYDDNDDVVVNVISEPRGTGSPMFLKAIVREIDR